MRGKVKKRARTREAATQATHSACDNDDNDRQTTQETIARRSVGAIRHKSLLLLLQLLQLLTLLLLLHLLSTTSITITTTLFYPLCTVGRCNRSGGTGCMYTGCIHYCKHGSSYGYDLRNENLRPRNIYLYGCVFFCCQRRHRCIYM